MELKTKAQPQVKKKKKLTQYDLQMYSLWVIPLSLVFIFAYLPMGGAIIWSGII